MLRRRHHPQAQAAREAEGRQEADEDGGPRRGAAGGLHRRTVHWIDRGEGRQEVTPRVPLGSPEPRAVAVVVRGAKLLVIARRLDGQEYAVLPGGGIEPGESPEQAAVRELAEECSLEGIAVRRLFDGE